MSLYYEAAALLANPEKTGGSLKSRLFKKKDLKSSPGQLYALITEASKWSPVLKNVIEKSGVLAEEKKLTPILALLLTHDVVLSKNGVAAAANHVLKLAINRHKARLTAEFTKARVRAGFPTINAFREAVNNGEFEEEDEDEAARGVIRHPRWVRINTLTTSLKEQLSTTFAGYTEASSLQDILSSRGSAKLYFIDAHIPNLLALPSKIDLSRNAAYLAGQLIMQDKASCFPAYLLNPTPEDGDAIDGCAAPGNKTTHLAAILHSQHHDGRRVFAFERDALRAKTLEKMVHTALADQIVTVKAAHDFLASKPTADEFANVGAILLDPSCSGSGIVGRDDVLKIHLPSTSSTSTPTARGSNNNKKRKRGADKPQDTTTSSPTTLRLPLDNTTIPEQEEEETSDTETATAKTLSDRLTALSTFQLRILTHAMSFPAARKITYSTCSTHFEENEGVVLRALAWKTAKRRGWRVLRREEQVEGMKAWGRRGEVEAEKLERLGGRVLDGVEDVEGVVEGCVRCEKGTGEGTMGFFVAAFVRDDGLAGREDVDTYPLHETDSKAGEALEADDQEDEWNGFSDDNDDVNVDTKTTPSSTTAPPTTTPSTTTNPTSNGNTSKSKKKKRRNK
ncbi:S-adenosyl-L-methionine-dependent methyltransferase [Aaosphaeria arxii CBS 175.79]|uniref:S-adenosyl-L-methionine-dependent methyltransferase n=1 Tax=Aaosphaeria arxii CBS 175.79 TaxID=1450172 RepID=A0A6A5XD95_9PLEO|nr:S-adenosyl-L-methionine-dependent methyltransferase [Aaosphaeria arxii CBS 175.79]KAF2010889.1 S-adenosyl-L-methionine-dependent methyltransferase [Aaosphaeria arxii CBS 175.79]